MLEKNSNRNLIFEINERDTGKQYRIYSNGEIEGFSDDAWVINHHGATVLELDATKAPININRL